MAVRSLEEWGAAVVALVGLLEQMRDLRMFDH